MKEKFRKIKIGYNGGRHPGYQGQETPPTPKLYRGTGYTNEPSPPPITETKNEIQKE